MQLCMWGPLAELFSLLKTNIGGKNKYALSVVYGFHCFENNIRANTI